MEENKIINSMTMVLCLQHAFAFPFTSAQQYFSEPYGMSWCWISRKPQSGFQMRVNMPENDKSTVRQNSAVPSSHHRKALNFGTDKRRPVKYELVNILGSRVAKTPQ